MICAPGDALDSIHGALYAYSEDTEVAVEYLDGLNLIKDIEVG